MKMFICTRVRGPRMHTVKTGIPGLFDTHWIVDTDADRHALSRGYGVALGKIHVANPPHIPLTRVSWVRDWMCRAGGVVPLGEWVTVMDDNINHFTCLPDGHYHCEKQDFGGHEGRYWRAAYATPANPVRVRELMEEMAARCESAGTIYGGYVSENNYYWRPKHWRGPTGYVKTKAAVYKNDGSPWYPWEGCMFEDYLKSADVVARYGRIVINNYARPSNKYWEAGGIGSESERRQYLLHDVAELARRYPGLVGAHPEIPTNARFLLRTERQVESWRLANGYLSSPKTAESTP
jgi:hypothetical protein